MNGYKIKRHVYNYPPLTEFTNRSNKVTINGFNYELLKLTSEALNFTFDYKEIDQFGSVEITFENGGGRENGGVDIPTVTHILGSEIVNIYIEGKILVGKVFRAAKMSLIAPILYTPNNPGIF